VTNYMNGSIRGGVVAWFSVCALTAPATVAASEETAPIDIYAECMAKHHYRDLAKVLDSGFDEVFVRALAEVSVKKCDSTIASTAKQAELRGPLFAAMYRRFAPQAGSAASNILRGWTPKLTEGDPRWGWYVVSNCLVKNQPDATREWVIAKPGSDRAARKKQNVVAALPKCLPAGQEFEISAAVLAGLIAETVYQIDFATSSGDEKRF
jgi:hypothetical protein